MSIETLVVTTCVENLSELLDSAVAGYVRSNADGAAALRSIMMRLGTETPEFQAWQRVFSQTMPRVQAVGTMAASAEAVELLRRECTNIHGVASTSTTSTPTSQSTAPSPGSSQSSLDVGSSPGSAAVIPFSSVCTGGPIYRIRAIECTLAAWGAGVISNPDFKFISDEVRRQLGQATTNGTPVAKGCNVISSRIVGNQYESTDLGEIECSFALSDGRTVKLIAADSGVGLNATVSRVIIQ